MRIKEVRKISPRRPNQWLSGSDSQQPKRAAPMYGAPLIAPTFHYSPVSLCSLVFWYCAEQAMCHVPRRLLLRAHLPLERYQTRSGTTSLYSRQRIDASGRGGVARYSLAPFDPV